MNPEVKEKWLAAQLKREHREGRAEEELARQRRAFQWDIEGWSTTDQLLLYIPGLGLLRIPQDEVVRLANALLAEHEFHNTVAWQPPDDPRCPEVGVRGTRCTKDNRHYDDCEFEETQ